MTNSILLCIITPSEKEAKKIAISLMHARLIASANILLGVTSFYRWKDQVIHTDETVMIAKTRKGLAKQTVAVTEELHSYNCPGILVLPIKDGSKVYLDWLAEVTGNEK